MVYGYGPYAGRKFKRPSKAGKAGAILLAGCLALALISLQTQLRNSKQNGSDRSGLFAQTAPDRTTRKPIDYILDYASREASDYPEECRKRYHGLPFLQTIISSWEQPVCKPQGSGSLQSSIRCWFQFDQYAEAYCTGANLAIDIAKFKEEEQQLMPFPMSNRNDQNFFACHPRPGVAGELLGDCTLNATVDGKDMWQEASFGKGGQKWLYHSFKSTAEEAQQPKCVAWVEHPVYFLNDKYDSINVWHALEDVTHAFEAYALKGWGDEVQVVVFDDVDVESVLGPTYLPVWRKVFSPVRPPITLRNLVKQEAQKLEQEAALQGSKQLPEGAAICFKDIFFAVHGGISVLSRSISAWTPCHNSTMIQSLVHFMLDGLQLTDVRPASHSGGKLRVLWALRANRAEYQQEILDLLKSRIPEEANAEVVAVDLGTLSIEEQIRRVRQADVLVGYHGAALTLAVYMNWHSGLVEIEEAFRCTCYTNCALWRDHPYTLLRVGEEPTSAALAKRVVEEVKKMLPQVSRRINTGAGAGSDPSATA